MGWVAQWCNDWHCRLTTMRLWVWSWGPRPACVGLACSSSVCVHTPSTQNTSHYPKNMHTSALEAQNWDCNARCYLGFYAAKHSGDNLLHLWFIPGGANLLTACTYTSYCLRVDRTECDWGEGPSVCSRLTEGTLYLAWPGRIWGHPWVAGKHC